MKKWFRMAAGLIGAAALLTLGFCALIASSTPDSLKTSRDSSFDCYGLPLSVRDRPETETWQTDPDPVTYQAKLYLFGSIPVKTVEVTTVSRKTVCPGGQPFGIRLYTEGLVVTGCASVPTAAGEESPAEQAGILSGDILLSVNEQDLFSSEQLSSLVESSGGQPLSFRLRRDGKTLRRTFSPVMDRVAGHWRLGLWVKDSCAGIGTMTYTDPSSGTFAGLGHGIYDSASGSLMPLYQGDIVKAEITASEKSTAGSPGSLIGRFTGTTWGTLQLNDGCGLYGTLNACSDPTEWVPLAFRQEVVRGPAVLRTTIGSGPAEDYQIEITDISYQDDQLAKNMVLRVTDERLLSETGGIVRGMSGSPILQNGRLVGALTHVFVDDPQRGYAVFAEVMEEKRRSLADRLPKAG